MAFLSLPIWRGSFVPGVCDTAGSIFQTGLRFRLSIGPAVEEAQERKLPE
jgi:hypothetical protein